MTAPLVAKALSIDFKLVGTGWATFTVRTDSKEVQITASYLGHALEDLALAVISVLEGNPEAKCAFDEEPGEYRWNFRLEDAGSVVFEILEFKELWGNRPDSEGTSIFHVKCPLRMLHNATLQTLSATLSEYGIKGYKEKWHEHEYPMAQLRRLEELHAST